jgi:hypothetical protein
MSVDSWFFWLPSAVNQRASGLARRRCSDHLGGLVAFSHVAVTDLPK